MFFTEITDRGATPALAATLGFGEAKLRMIAENVANAHTPRYRAKTLNTDGFQRSLKRALDQRVRHPGKPLRIESGREVRTDGTGSIQVRPSYRPLSQILFHDGTNLSVEREMAELAKTGMMHELASSLLRQQFDGLRKAIRGVVS